MNIGIAVDNTIPLHMPTFIRFMQNHGTAIRFNSINLQWRLSDTAIEYESAIKALNNGMRAALKEFDIAILVTGVRYENNFFYEGGNGVYIVSLSDWNVLTTLPMSNGLAYLICQILSKHEMDIGEDHELNTGCINDFLWDKRGIDVCMKAAFVCDHCRRHSEENRYLASQEFAEVVSILNSVSAASRGSVDILAEVSSVKESASAVERAFDVFICHNSVDKPRVRLLGEALRNAGIRTWLDEDQIRPGELWQDKLEVEISRIASCIIVVGDSGAGPWQDMERRAFISEFANRQCKIIPVLVGEPQTPPPLPLFLKQFMWSDLRNDDGRQLAKLIAALRN